MLCRMVHFLVTFMMFLSFAQKCTNGWRTSFLPTSTRGFAFNPSLRSRYLPTSHRYGRNHYCLSTPRASLLRPLSSTPAFSSNEEEEIMRGTDSVDGYLSKLRAQGRITAEEAQSISAANSINADTTKAVINESIDTYLSTKQYRMKTGGQSIGNPGLYVRSIVRKQLLEMDREKANSTGSKLGHERGERVGETASNDNLLQPLLQNNDISEHELSPSCLLALRRSLSAIAETALKAYATQKRRRELKGMEKISDPSSYVMAVLRNNMADTTVASSSPKLDPPKSVVLKNDPSAPTVEKKIDRLRENTLPPTPIESERTRPIQQKEQPQQHRHIPQTERVFNHMQTRKVKDAVDMDYVDKCLSYLVKLEEPLRQLPGIGPKTEESFHQIGLWTLRDLLWHFPRSFIDRSKLASSIQNVEDGEVGTFRLTVHSDKVRHNTVLCTDEAGNDVYVTHFYGRSRQGIMMASAATKKLCKEGIESMIVSGKVKHSQRAEIYNPDIVVPYDQADEVLDIEPVYALSSGLTQKKMIAAIDNALVVAQELLSLLPESLPEELLEELSWPKLADALTLAHKPTSIAEAGVDSPARQRVAFEELSMQQAQLALSRWKLKHQGVDAQMNVEVEGESVGPSWRDSPLVSAAVSTLPFNLTSSQVECLDEMWGDAITSNNGRMIRLLQGDVGSGKTVLAYLLGLGCIEARQGGGQVVALLCPTQLLAAQHEQSISDFAARLQGESSWNIRVELLTGNVVGASRHDLLKRLETAQDNDAVFLIGTHALTTPDIAERLKQLPAVTADNTKGGLALAIVDEEQRFGVRQRQVLTNCAANSLFMSATPIPRSISLMRSGLMDSTILQSENRHVETTIVTSDNLEKVVTVLQKKIDAGSKCFWVLPRIQGGDDSHKSNVIERYNVLVTAFGKERVCCIHGQMNVKDREEELARFSDSSSEVAVLVGTTVIEVGIDIPDVNILIVEDANNFGLSQLHQLRGRIGRAGSRPDLKCHCILLSDATGISQDNSSLSRLQYFQLTNRGDQIADADFMLRGPGEMLGFQQSGIKSGFTVDPANHWGLLESATMFGRGFLHHPSDSLTSIDAGISLSNDTLAQHLSERTSFYDQTSASSKSGLALRMMISLFGEWKSDESNTLDAIMTLKNIDESKGELLTQDDKSIDTKIVAMAQAFISHTGTSRADAIRADTSHAKAGIEAEEPALPVKPHVAALQSQVPTKSRVNLLGDVMFVVLDVETTGLDEKSCHVIQLAAKVLGSDDENDLFSEYILPPIDRIPAKIEELTGITDEFLRQGGFDTALGKERGVAREFRPVFLDFRKFLQERANGRDVVFVAHNAKFDIRMINGELRRWRLSDQEEMAAPVLGDIFSTSLDTLQLFRQGKWWRSSAVRTSLGRPSSFSLSGLYSHVFDESVTNSHNAVGDIRALERLLLSDQFEGWKSTANTIQEPFIRVDG